jgi:hypothetical protein
MDERLPLAETIFHQLIEAPAEERAAKLAELRACDPDLRALWWSGCSRTTGREWVRSLRLRAVR